MISGTISRLTTARTGLIYNDVGWPRLKPHEQYGEISICAKLAATLMGFQDWGFEALKFGIQNQQFFQAE